MSKLIIGAEGGLYTNSGTWDNPVWTQLKHVRDIGLNPPFDAAEFLSRETPVKLSKKSLIGIEVTVQIRADPTKASYQAWVDAAMERLTYFDVLVLNTKINVAGGRGVRGNFQVYMNSELQTLPEGVYGEFTLRPYIDDDDNTVVVALVAEGGASVTYTEITYDDEPSA